MKLTAAANTRLFFLLALALTFDSNNPDCDGRTTQNVSRAPFSPRLPHFPHPNPTESSWAQDLVFGLVKTEIELKFR